jgi:hypothetical protein
MHIVLGIPPEQNSWGEFSFPRAAEPLLALSSGEPPFPAFLSPEIPQPIPETEGAD